MIYVTFQGVEYELPYDNDTLQLNRTIDSTFDNGYFETTPLSSAVGLDFSRKIPRNLLVRIEYDEETFYMRTGETNIDKLSYGTTPRYVHRVNLVSLSKDLTKKTLENITLTQPKGDFGIYSRSVNIGEADVTGGIGGSLTYPITFDNVINSNLSKIDGMTVVSLEQYNIAVTVELTYLPTIIDLDLTVNIKYGATTIRSELINVPIKISFREQRIVRTLFFNYTPTMATSFSVEIVRDILSGPSVDAKVSFSITGLTVDDKPVRTYANLIDKMLHRSEYVLSPQSRARLNLTAPEGKYEELTLYDALNRIAAEESALVRVGDLINERIWKATATITGAIIQDSIYDASPYDYDLGNIIKIGDRYYENAESGRKRREIIFEYFDNPSLFDPIGEYDRTGQAELEDYVSAVELNTKNVLKAIRYSPFRDGWKSLRNLDSIGQFTTDNIGFETEDIIEKPIQVLVKGLASRNAANTITWDATDITDITSRVLEKRQWDTLPSQSDYSYTGKEQLLKNNTLYYIQGDNKIYGMSHTGEHLSTLIGNANVVRSLYETILAVRSLEISELVTRTGTQSNDDPATDGTLAGDLAIQMQVAYSNITESRARVYKDDQTGFEQDLIKYLNESSNVNDSESIGNYAQQIVNRLGGTKIIVSGVVDSLADVPQLGDHDSEGRVYTIIELKLGYKIHYTYVLVQDYNVISSYIGINSRHRVEEISSDSTTNRTLRYTSKFIFSDTEKSFTTRMLDSQNILGSLLAETSDGITYGYLECNLSNGEQKKIHLSVDSDSKGKTIEIKWNLLNNYSAGLKRESFVRGSDTIWVNTDVIYTDYYGKVNDILFILYYSANNTYDTDMYPEADINDGNDMFIAINDTIDKDAGEVLHGLVEIPLLSESSKIRVYNGFARWNKLVEGTDRIRACALEYIPMKNANKIDTTRIRDLTVTGTATFGKLNLQFTLGSSAKGIAYYNIDTLDLVLAYVDDLTSGAKSIDLYYYIQDSVFGGGQNFYSQIIMDAISISITPTYYRSKDVDGFGEQDISILMNASGFPSNNFEGDSVQSIAITIMPSYERSVDFGSSQTQGINITIVPSYTRSSDYVSAQAQSIGVSETYEAIRFKDGGTSPSGGSTCISGSDIGNVVCDSSQSCSFVSVGVYSSQIDDTNTATPCSAGAQRIECMWDGSAYFCIIKEGTITTTYSNCKTCEVV